MANTNFETLKKNALRRCDYYNSNDSTLLELAGSLINDCLSYIQTQIKTSPYVEDIGNSVNTTASQAYVDLTDTDILEILNVYQLTTDTKLKRLTRDEFVQLQPDTTANTGTPELCYYPTQSLNVSGQNIWTLYFIPTPSSAIAIYYDYLKNFRFSADGTSADAEFSPLPNMFDDWIFRLFKPKFLSIIDAENATRIRMAENDADRATVEYRRMIVSPADYKPQLTSIREKGPLIRQRVATTPEPT